MFFIKKLKNFFQNHSIKVSISTFCVVVALMDAFVKNISYISAAALSIALVPWIVQFVEKLSVPGLFEAEFRKTEEKLKETMSAKGVKPTESDYAAFEYLKTRDPNIALVALRIEIEKRLRFIYSKHPHEGDVRDRRPFTINELLRDMEQRNVIGRSVSSLIKDMMPVLNKAAHGVEFSEDASTWVFENGPKLLAILDEKH